MLPLGYNPENYGGKVWWNDENPEMREIWGTQEDYDNFKENGGTWQEYVRMVQERMKSKKVQTFNASTTEAEENSHIRTR